MGSYFSNIPILIVRLEILPAQILSWLMIIGDDTTQYTRFSNNPLGKSVETHQDCQWNETGSMNTRMSPASMMVSSGGSPSHHGFQYQYVMVYDGLIHGLDDLEVSLF